MTLLDVIRLIEAAASRHPAVRTVCRRDVFAINARPDVRYGVFAWLQGEHSADLRYGQYRFAFTLFYVDRLTAGRSNLEEVQSTGMEMLRSILLSLDEAGVSVEGSPAFTTFRERFVDECGGVFCRVTLAAPQDGTCPEDLYGIVNDNVDFI